MGERERETERKKGRDREEEGERESKRVPTNLVDRALNGLPGIDFR